MPKTTPSEVLNFWYGAAWEKRDLLNDGAFISAQGNIWYSGGAKIDAQCAEFADLIRSAGRRELKGREWYEPTGVLAQIILMDQLSRGAFRGTAEAFAYDEVALEVTHSLLTREDVFDAFTWPEAHFSLSPLIHSEALSDQEILVKRMQQLAEKYPNIPMAKFSVPFAISHMEVVKQFGRFPHRNAALGRQSTAEELEWLASDKVPGWAKSQATEKV